MYFTDLETFCTYR